MFLTHLPPQRRSKKVLVAFLIIGLLIGGVTQAVRASDTLERKLGIFVQVLDIVKNDYVERSVDYSKVMYGAIRGMLDALDDPYTRFMEPKAFKEMGLRQGGEYSGIGIYIGIRDKQLTVIAPIRATPAARAKVRAGDKIMTIEGKSTQDMALDEAVSLIRGKKGTTVTLGIVRGEETEPRNIDVVRERIIVNSIQTQAFREGRVGYIRLITFENQNAAEEMRKGLIKLKERGATGLIVDLRNNGGGLLRNAVEIAGYFIGEKAVVHTVDRDKNRETLTAHGEPIWTGPLVVLINNASASASEILAGAIHDHGIGKLVGEPTFGKASVQNIRPLDDGSALLVTIAKYLTPSDHDISKKGVSPDIEVKLPEEIKGHEDDFYDEFGDLYPHKDTQLGRAVDVVIEEMTRQGLWRKQLLNS